MLEDAGERDRVRLREFTDRGFARTEPSEHGPADGVGEGHEGAIHRRCIVYHMVNYWRCRPRCQDVAATAAARPLARHGPARDTGSDTS